MLVNNAKRFVVIPKISNGTKFVITHKAKENVSPKETSVITMNGTYNITPSKGFNAMKEVEVDVNIGEFTTEEKIVDITSNGEVEILPTSADAMTKVTANVQVPPPPLEEKQVTITKAKTTEIITPDADVYGLSRVEVSTDIPLESKQITITENGTTTIEASEGFEGIESVEVTTDVNTLQGLDFSNIYDAEQANEINQHYKDGIKYAKQIKAENTNPSGSWENKFISNNEIIVFPNIDTKYITSFYRCFFKCSKLEYIMELDVISASDLYYTFGNCGSLKKVPPTLDLRNVTTIYCLFYNCVALNKLPLMLNTQKITNAYAMCYACRNIPQIELNLPSVENLSYGFYECASATNAVIFCPFNKTLNQTFSGCSNITSIEITTDSVTDFSLAFYLCYNVNVIKLTNVNNGVNFNRAFDECRALTSLQISKWKQSNMSIPLSPILSPESIHYIIQNAMNVADGATARTLTLHATAKTNWQNSEYYEQDLAVLSTKGITIA